MNSSWCIIGCVLLELTACSRYDYVIYENYVLIIQQLSNNTRTNLIHLSILHLKIFWMGLRQKHEQVFGNNENKIASVNENCLGTEEEIQRWVTENCLKMVSFNGSWHWFLFWDFIVYCLSSPKQHIHSLWANKTHVN